MVRRSELEIYIDILKILARQGPLKLTHIMRKANVCCKFLKRYLEFLTNQNLVQEIVIDKKRHAYVITERGRKVLKSFREMSVMLKTNPVAQFLDDY